jgi:hypothetical protein
VRQIEHQRNQRVNTDAANRFISAHLGLSHNQGVEMSTVSAVASDSKRVFEEVAELSRKH